MQMKRMRKRIFDSRKLRKSLLRQMYTGSFYVTTFMGPFLFARVDEAYWPITQEDREDLSLISIQLNHAGNPCRPDTNFYPEWYLLSYLLCN